VPSGAGAARKHGRGTRSINVGTEYNSLQKKQRQDEQESRARFLAGDFRGTNKWEAQRLVQVESYLNSPDEEALELERQWIREKTLLATTQFNTKNVGRTFEPTPLQCTRHSDVVHRASVCCVLCYALLCCVLLGCILLVCLPVSMSNMRVCP